jgi:UDP-glucose 4-epimerase
MILVTGGTGSIGPHVARALLDLGERCVLTRRSSAHVPEFVASQLGERVLIEQLDLADRKALLELGQAHRITGIVHLAAVPFAGMEPLEYVKLSSKTLFNVLEAAQRWDVRRVCLASTIGGSTQEPSVPVRSTRTYRCRWQPAPRSRSRP